MDESGQGSLWINKGTEEKPEWIKISSLSDLPPRVHQNGEILFTDDELNAALAEIEKSLLDSS